MLIGIGFPLLAKEDAGIVGRSMNFDYNLTNTQISKLKQEALSGDNGAAKRLALYYDFVTMDYTSAYVWFKKAADNGDAVAQFNLGVRSLGKNNNQGCNDAKHWFSLARDNGLVKAQNELDRLGDCSKLK